MFEKIKKIIKNNKIITILICTIFAMLYVLYTYNNININGGFQNIKYAIFFWGISSSLFVMLSFLIIIILYKKEIKLHLLFLTLASIFGVYYLVVAPVQNGSDEVAHFYRAFEVATGQFRTIVNDEGEYIDKDVPISFIELTNSEEVDHSIKIHDIKEKSMIELRKDEVKNKKANTGASVYSPVVYIPQAIGIALGMFFKMKPLIILNISRIFGFIIWLIISTYAIKIVPTKREFFVLLALLPANITSAITLSADTILNAFALLLTAKTFEIAATEKKIEIKDYIILLLSSVIIGQCKMAYLPLILICSLISKDRYKNKKKYFIGTGIIIIVSLLGTYTWMKLAASSHYGGGTNEQQIWILSHPVSYIIVIFRTIIEYFSNLFYGVAAGNTLYQARVNVPPAISSLMMICLIISLWQKESTINIKLFKKIIILFVMGLISLLVLTAMYISATTIVTGQIGTRIIEGLQGRYFIPVIMLSVFLVNKKRININEKNIYAASIMLQFAVILQTMQTFI